MDFDVARRRVGVTGTLTSHLEFEDRSASSKTAATGATCS
jgi:hypothetical protein